MKLFGLLVAGVAASERGSSDPSEEQGNLRAPIMNGFIYTEKFTCASVGLEGRR